MLGRVHGICELVNGQSLFLILRIKVSRVDIVEREMN